MEGSAGATRGETVPPRAKGLCNDGEGLPQKSVDWGRRNGKKSQGRTYCRKLRKMKKWHEPMPVVGKFAHLENSSDSVSDKAQHLNPQNAHWILKATFNVLTPQDRNGSISRILSPSSENFTSSVFFSPFLY